jgi:hypothetical protein
MVKAMNTTCVIDILEREEPKFQINNTEVHSVEKYFADQAHKTEDLSRKSFASTVDCLKYIQVVLGKGARTIETGGGWSTCVFANISQKHICINPDITANEMIVSFLKEHNIDYNELIFINKPSDQGLPELADDELFDGALIDGNHSFPIPIIDWHYIDIHLRQGGILFVDDNHINAVTMVSDFLISDGSYKEIKRIGCFRVFEKTKAGRTWGWKGQAINNISIKDQVIADITPKIITEKEEKITQLEKIYLKHKITEVLKESPQICFYGAGKYLEKIKEYSNIKTVNIYAVFDDIRDGSLFMNVPIQKIEHAVNVPENIPIILCTDTWQKEMKKKLASISNIKSSVIDLFDEDL